MRFLLSIYAFVCLLLTFILYLSKGALGSFSFWFFIFSSLMAHDFVYILCAHWLSVFFLEKYLLKFFVSYYLTGEEEKKKWRKRDSGKEVKKRHTD